MPDYQMVSKAMKVYGIGDTDPSLFNSDVNKLLAKGYELYGPPSVISTKNTDGETIIVYSQALLKP